MNMTKIAKLAGCSLSTVSKAFRNSPEISEETKQRIFEIAKEGDCFVKYYAPIYENKVIAVICKELVDSTYGDLVESLNQKISRRGDTLLISSSNFARSTLEGLIDYYVNYHRVDGLILVDYFMTGNESLKNFP
ncbi:MAG: LacI family DNA-binding transcriptional regulator, partial [Clostridia bacterium]|nr:LacI family DNA-binding transcriptional regulator [Clostridia bacterium]